VGVASAQVLEAAASGKKAAAAARGPQRPQGGWWSAQNATPDDDEEEAPRIPTVTFATGAAVTTYNETRVWEKQASGAWVCVHFHKSAC
jgi:hypothetical protein